jgi:hypothetical protein
VSDDIIAFLKEFSDDFHTITKDIEEILVLVLGNLPDQRKVQRHSTNVASTNSNSFALLIVPFSEVRPASLP